MTQPSLFDPQDHDEIVEQEWRDFDVPGHLEDLRAAVHREAGRWPDKHPALHAALKSLTKEYQP